MAAFRTTKIEVRPVLNFHELNRFVACDKGSNIIDVCDDKMRMCKRLVNIISAYLQLHAAKEL